MTGAPQRDSTSWATCEPAKSFRCSTWAAMTQVAKTTMAVEASRCLRRRRSRSGVPMQPSVATRCARRMKTFRKARAGPVQTGPAVAPNYAPVVEAMKAYLEHVNGRGGVNGKSVRIVVLDDQAQPSRAATNTKQLL